MRRGMIRGGRAIASLALGFAISTFLLLEGWLGAHAFSVAAVAGRSVAEQVRRVLSLNVSVIARLALVMLISSGLAGILVYAVWTVIDRRVRRRKA